MKKIIILIAVLLSAKLSKAQIVSLEAAAASNYSPTFAFAPFIGAQYHLKGGDYVGLASLYDWSRQRETYIARYGTDINKRFYLNAGVGFVNDWKTPQANGLHKTYRTYVIGADYVFRKASPNHVNNFYVGFDFTDEIVYLKAGIKLFHEKRSN